VWGRSRRRLRHQAGPGSDPEDFLSSDGIIAGSPVYFGSMAAELKQVFDSFVHVRSQMADKVGQRSRPGRTLRRKETTILSILQAMLIYG